MSVRTTQRGTPSVPWYPASLNGIASGADELRQSWWYVLVEEVSDGVAFLERWPWPLADEKGRLFWPPEDHDAVALASLPERRAREQLYRPDLQRDPRAGDVFAVRQDEALSWGSGRHLVDDARDVFGERAVDVSADARLAAKLAYQGSLVTPLAAERVEPRLREESRRHTRRLKARELHVDPVPPHDGGGAR